MKDTLINMKRKDIKGALSSLRQFLANESPLKMMKNPFYFILKALPVLKNFNFYLEFLIMSKNCLIRKTRLISKFMASQPTLKKLQYRYLKN